MRTIREAVALLSRLRSAGDLTLLLPALGFAGAPDRLDDDSVRALGLGPITRTAHVARGSGTLRALIMEPRSGLPVRDVVRRAADRLSRTSPHMLWLLMVHDTPGRTLAFASWTTERSRARMAVLVLELDHVLQSDAETLCALAAVHDTIDVLVHTRWVELLGRDALTNRFYRSLEQIVRSMADSIDSSVPADDRALLALLQASRLLFLCFLEAKGWLDGDRGFLMRNFNECMARGGNYHARILRPLLFGTLNTPWIRRAPAARAFGSIPFLNGGLFSRTAAEKVRRNAVISDEQFGRLFGDLLARYRFTAREDSSSWSEAAIDPEMLGKSFESLMASRERHSSGAFYTPQLMVEQVTRSALLRAVCAEHGISAECADAILAGREVGGETAQRLRRRIRAIRVMDPACGSGAFLVHALERISGLLAASGDVRPAAVIRRGVLTSAIFGVDVNPTAVWLCELRLWLSIVIDSEVTDARNVPALPNLDHNIRVGDSLAGGDFTALAPGSMRTPGLARLRSRYVRATGSHKVQLARQLDRAERERALILMEERLRLASQQRREIIAAERSRDLFGERSHRQRTRHPVLDDLRQRARELRASLRAMTRGGALPFSFASHFPEAASNAGFDIVLGNPPWVRTERIPQDARERLRRDFDSFRLANWRPESSGGSAGRGFAAQVDLAAFFVERSLSLLRPGGIIALLLPAKLWKSLAGSGLRRILMEHATVREVDDWSNAAPTFDAVVYPSVLIADRRPPDASAGSDAASSILASVHDRGHTLRWCIPYGELALGNTAGSPWLLVPSEVRAAFERLACAGTPYGMSSIGTPRLGVKCGLNEAFTVHIQGVEGDLARVQAGGRSGRIERALLRPILRGEMISSWTHAPMHEHMVWTHDDAMRPLPHLPPYASRWMSRWRHDLSRRSDLRGSGRWWSVFRTEGARTDRWRVVWSDIGRSPRATVLEPGNPAIPINSCYVALLNDHADALALATLLNGPLCAAWLGILAEQARGGYYRYFSWTLSLLPLPREWMHARDILRSMGTRLMRGEHIAADELLAETLRAYGVSHDDIGALLTWNAR